MWLLSLRAFAVMLETITSSGRLKNPACVTI
jgi:hypothetical protein